MKKYLYIFYVLGIIISIYLLSTKQSSKLGNFMPLVYYAIIIMCVVALVTAFSSNFTTTFTFGFLKTLLVSLAVGVLAVSVLFVGISLYDKSENRTRVKKHLAKVKQQKKTYEELSLLEKFEAHIDWDDVDKINAVSASVEFSEDTSMEDWTVQLVVFVKPDRNRLLLEHRLFESDAIPLRFDSAQNIIANYTMSSYRIEGLKREVGTDFQLEYLLIFKNPSSTYQGSLGLDEGFAYTSLSPEEVEERDGAVSIMQSRRYALYSCALMAEGEGVQISLGNLRLDAKNKL